MKTFCWPLSWALVSVLLFVPWVTTPSYGEPLDSVQPSVQAGPGTPLSDVELYRFLRNLEERKYNNFDLAASMRESALKIPLDRRFEYYEKYKVSGLWGILNVYFVGSIFQGDPGTSAISFGGYLVGIGGASLAAVNNVPERNIWIATGLVVGLSCYVYGLVRPWFYAEEQNQKIRGVLFEKEAAGENP